MRNALILHEESNPSPPASPYPLGEGRYQLRPAVNPNVETRGAHLKVWVFAIIASLADLTGLRQPNFSHLAKRRSL